jgi:hypothetical protein
MVRYWELQLVIIVCLQPCWGGGRSQTPDACLATVAYVAPAGFLLSVVYMLLMLIGCRHVYVPAEHLLSTKRF